MRFLAAAAAVNEKIVHISLTASFVILLVLVPRGLFSCCLLGLELFSFPQFNFCSILFLSSRLFLVFFPVIFIH